VKKNKTGFFILLLFLLICLNRVAGQGSTNDKDSREKVVANTVEFINHTVGAQSGIYSGFEYQYERINIGDAFYGTTRFAEGTVVFDDVLYPAIPMLYDIVKDELVLQTFDKLHLYTLESNRVSQFSFLGHDFIRIFEDSLNGAVIKTGFYQRLYDGKTKAWSRNSKTIKEFTDYEHTLKQESVEKKQWFIYKEGIYFEVDGGKSIIKVLSDKKKEILQFIKKNKIRFKNNMDKALVQIVAHYDEITR